MASKVTGIQETVAAIYALGRTIRPSVKTSSVKALQPIKKAAKDNLVANGSVKRGVLHKSLAIKPVKTDKSGMAHQLTASGRGNRIAHLVEFGTEPHWQPIRGVMHPGADPKPFLTPAFEANDDAALKIFGETLVDALAKQLARKSSR